MNKKIIYITSQCPFGNGEIWAIQELNSLVENGVDVLIVPRTGYGKIIHQNAQKLLLRTISTPFINFAITVAFFKELIYYPRSLFTIIKWIIIHSDSISDFAKGLIVLPKSLFISSQLKTKGIEHIHAFSTTSVAVVAYIIAKKLKIPWSITFHSSWHLNSNHFRSTSAQIKSASFIRVISNEVKQSLTNFINPTLSEKIKLIHIGVKCDTVTANNTNPSNTLNIVSIGGLLPHKGIDISLLAAHKLLNAGILNFKWSFYGEGPLLNELLVQVKKMKLDKNVVFAGNIDNKDILSLYKTGEIKLLVQNSIKRLGIQEGIPVSLMEAMSCSIPVIATDCGGTKELVDGESGILIPSGDPDATYEAILGLINYPENCIILGRKGREKVEKEFNSQKISKDLIEFF